jgi:hypothetical protein
MGKAHGKQYAFRRRFGMNFKGQPFILNGEFFFQLVDNALADIAEGSYVVGEYAHLYGHGMSLSVVCSSRQTAATPLWLIRPAGKVHVLLMGRFLPISDRRAGAGVYPFSEASTCWKA